MTTNHAADAACVFRVVYSDHHVCMTLVNVMPLHCSSLLGHSDSHCSVSQECVGDNHMHMEVVDGWGVGQLNDHHFDQQFTTTLTLTLP